MHRKTEGNTLTEQSSQKKFTLLPSIKSPSSKKSNQKNFVLHGLNNSHLPKYNAFEDKNLKRYFTKESIRKTTIKKRKRSAEKSRQVLHGNRKNKKKSEKQKENSLNHQSMVRKKKQQLRKTVSGEDEVVTKADFMSYLDTIRGNLTKRKT